jgi:hypothetical protein
MCVINFMPSTSYLVGLVSLFSFELCPVFHHQKVDNKAFVIEHNLTKGQRKMRWRGEWHLVNRHGFGNRTIDLMRK